MTAAKDVHDTLKAIAFMVRWSPDGGQVVGNDALKDILDHIATLTRERDEARALCDETINLLHDADREADTLRTQLAAARVATARLNGVIEWMLGENGEFPVRPSRLSGKPYPMYYWRSELRARRDAALTAALTQEDA